MTAARPDSELADYDIEAAIEAGLHQSGPHRKQLLGDAAVAAALRADALEVDPYGVLFLANYVHSAGRSAAAALPQPLVGQAASDLARTWLRAALAAPLANPRVETAADDVFSRWLANVAAVMDLRRGVDRRPCPPSTTSPLHSALSTRTPRCSWAGSSCSSTSRLRSVRRRRRGIRPLSRRAGTTT